MAYIGKQPAIGNFVKLDAISTSSTNTYNLTLDSVAFTPESANHMLVSLNGVIQAPLTAFSVSGSTITFLPSSGTLSSSDSIDFIMVYGNVLDIGTPSDSTVTNAKTNFVSTSSAAGLQIKGDGTTDGTLQLNCSQNSHGVKLKSPAHSSAQSYTLTLPATAPATDKIIQTNSSGVLSFIDTPSGNLVKLANGSISSGTSALELEFFSSTYHFYHFYFENVIPSTASPLRFRLRDSSGNKTGSKYKHAFAHPYYQSTSSSGINAHGQWASDHINWGNNNIHTDSGQGAQGVIHFTNTHQSNKRPFYFGQKVSTEGGTQIDAHIGGGFYDEEFTAVGFSMYFQGYTITSGTYALYGVKSS